MCTRTCCVNHQAVGLGRQLCLDLIKVVNLYAFNLERTCFDLYIETRSCFGISGGERKGGGGRKEREREGGKLTEKWERRWRREGLLLEIYQSAPTVENNKLVFCVRSDVICEFSL